MKLELDELVKQENIDLSNNNLRDDDLDVLMKVIKQSTVLEGLNLYGNKLTLTDGKLANAIAKNSTIKRLNLFSNNIRDEGAKPLADALQVNDTLQQLNLYNNRIGDEGAKCIADMLVVNKTLQRIDLANNNIGDKGAQSIATSLVKNMGIQKIYLDDNMITDAGAEKLANALEGNHSIEELEVYGNKNISKDVMDRIKSILNNSKRKTLIANNKENKQETKGEDGKAKALKEENNRLKKELADAQKKVVTIKQEKDTAIAQKDQQLKSALDEIAERDKDIVNKNKQLDQLESIKRILNPDEGEPAAKRTRTEDTTNKPKFKSLQLKYEHTHCSICASKFSADLDNKDENIRKHLPVLSSSKTCDHYFCYGCILQQQAVIAEKKQAPKWISCMVCKTKTAFCPSEPKYHRLLIDILKESEWVDEAPKVKAEPAD